MPGVSDFLGLCGATLKDTFLFEKVVAQGGFGVVYRGRHLSLGKPVAIKVFSVPPEESIEEEAIQLFFQESKILATLEHPAIVRPYDCGTMTLEDHGDLPWIALEWLDGSTLGAILREHPRTRWSPRDALDLLRPVMEALAEAHSRGIAHRDIAPNNIMVCDTTRGRRVRLIDFGIACIRPQYREYALGSTEQTNSGIIAHSPKYPAPEQLLRQRTGPWTDVHALGLLMHTLLTGELPYPTSALDLDRGACARRRPTPGLVGVDVGAWEYVLLRAVELDPKARFADAGELLSALERTLEHASGSDDTDGAVVPEGWRAVDVSPSVSPISLQTPRRTALLHVLAPTADELRSGLELPVEDALMCRLVLQRFADTSLALSVFGRANERPGLYLTQSGGTRLTRLVLDPAGRRSIYCGQRSAGLRELVCYTARSREPSPRLSLDLEVARLRVRFDAPLREFLLVELDDPPAAQVRLLCVGVQ